MAVPSLDWSAIHGCMEQARATWKQQAKETEGRIITKLAEIGVVRVEIVFDGAGDEGQVELVDYITTVDADGHALARAGDEAMAGILIAMPDPAAPDRTLKARLGQVIEDWTYAALEGLGVNWYDNAGGHGRIELHIADGAENPDAEPGSPWQPWVGADVWVRRESVCVFDGSLTPTSQADGWV